MVRSWSVTRTVSVDDFFLSTTDPQLVSAAPHSELSKSLLSRHVVMISIGGIIGAGLFVGSSAAIASVGPAVIVSYCLAGAVVLVVMRMLSEMAAATPGIGSFTEYIRLGLGHAGHGGGGWDRDLGGRTAGSARDGDDSDREHRRREARS